MVNLTRRNSPFFLFSEFFDVEILLSPYKGEKIRMPCESTWDT
jgi:hypothetical protein